MRSREHEPFSFQTFEPRLLLTVGIYPSSDGHLEVHVEQLPPAADYQIYRGNALGSWTPVADLGALDPYIGGDFVDTGVSIAGGSVYRYAAYDGNGNPLDTATLYTVSQIGAVVTDYTTAHLNWENNEPTLQFSLSRDATFLGNLGNASSYTDTGLELNTWYNYALNETTANQWSTIEVITAPPSPSDPVATAVSGQEIDLHLSNSTSFQGPYNIYRSLTPDFAPDAAHFVAESGGQQFADTTVVSGTTYYYQITSFNPTVGLESPPSDTSATTPVGSPVVTGQPIHAIAGSAYHGIVATFSQAGSGSGPAEHSAEINWGDGSPNGSTNGTSPDLAIIDNPDGTYSVIGTHTYAICSRTSATASVLVTYPFLAMQDSATSSVSIVEPPAAVSGFSATAGSPGSVDLNWSINGELTATAFRIDASTDGGTTFQPIGQVDAPDTSFDAVNLEGKTHYTFRVTPVNEAGDGVASAVLLTTGAVGKWYKVSFMDSVNPGATAEPFSDTAGSTVSASGSSYGLLALTSAAQANGGWVYADSMSDAVLQAISGSVTDSQGVTFTLGTSAAFTFQTAWSVGGRPVGSSVVFRESADTVLGGAGNDLLVDQVTVTPEALFVTASADQTNAPGGALGVGMFTSADSTAPASDFHATVTWSNGVSSNAIITPTPDGAAFGVSIVPPMGVDASIYSLTVIHNPTGFSDQDSLGGATQPSQTTYSTLTASKFNIGTSKNYISNITLSWKGKKALASGTHYRIFRVDANGVEIQKDFPGNGSWQDVSITPANNYIYSIQIINDSTGVGGSRIAFGAPIQTYYARDNQNPFISPKTRLDSASTTSDPTGEKTTWNWNKLSYWATGIQFKLFRTDDPYNIRLSNGTIGPNPAFNKFKSFINLYPEIASQSYTIDDVSAGTYGSTIYYYTLVAYENNIAFAQTTVVAPQYVFQLGLRATDITKADYRKYVEHQGYQFHPFFYTETGSASSLDTTTAEGLLNTLPASLSVVLGGLSLGGGEAVRITQEMQNRSIGLLTLFDPVSNYDDGITLAVSGLAPFYEQRFNGSNVPIDPKNLTEDEMPKSTFFLPTMTTNSNGRSTVTSKIAIAYNWHQTFAKEFPAGGYGVATGSIANLSSALDWHDVISGTYHTSQFDIPTNPAFFEADYGTGNPLSILPNIRKAIDTKIAWTL